MTKHVKVSKEALIKSKDNISVDLFLRRQHPDGNTEYVLFAKAGLKKTAYEKKIRDLMGYIYVKEDDFNLYSNVIEKSLNVIIDDKEIPFNEKTDIVYQCATGIVRDVFSDPRSGENIQRSRNIVDEMVTFSFKEPGAIKGLMGLSKKDYYTFSHCVHVSIFCVGLARVFNVKSRNHLRQLGLGALLHDVGKSKIDQNILNKPGKLTPEEFEVIKTHSRLGYETYKGLLPEASLDVILHHHEKYDGTGYPGHLSKDDISLFAKIAGIADVYDALTTNRVYAKARDPFDAIMTMKNYMIGHFEQDKFLSFIKMLGPSFII